MSIKTLGLGSCVAITAFQAATGLVGMAHVVLPDSRGHRGKVRRLPGYFADTAVAALFDEMDRRIGGRNRYLVKLVGGAAVLHLPDAAESMNIGKRNVLAVKKALHCRGIGVAAEDVAGTISRSVEIAYGQYELRVCHGGRLVGTL